ncbi:MAG: AEC family transporter [Clostridia bacterium]|nr:AEC family transporter [Clostridia bacterium]
MLKNVAIFVLLALPGYLLVKCKILDKKQSGALSILLMYVGMPFLIFASTINNLTLDRELLVIILIVMAIGIVYTFAMFFMSKPLTQKEREEKTQGMMRFSAVFSNNGFLGIPLAIAVFGANSLVSTVVIILNIITNILMFTLGIYLISGDKKTISLKKAFLNPVLIAFILGVIANLLNVNKYLPEVGTYSTYFSNVVAPISMTILGMKMGDVKFFELFKSWKIYYVAILKLVVFPLLITLIVFLLNKVFNAVNVDVVLGFLIAFSMPTAGLASTFSDSFGGDTQNAVAFTLGTTILSIITIPLLYWGFCTLLI